MQAAQAGKKKTPPEDSFSISNQMIVDWAAINAGFDFGRYAFAAMLL
jgi:hypothetical protein